jgi:hypothetical protein
MHICLIWTLLVRSILGRFLLPYWDVSFVHLNNGHLGHLGYLGTIGNLDTLDPYSLDTALTDSPLEAFITKLDPEDPGPSEGYYKEDLLNPLSYCHPLTTNGFPF